MNPARISAVALLLMALGLGLLYHHAPYYWAARTATIVGALLPAVFLTRRMPSRLPAALAAVIALLMVGTLASGLWWASDPWQAYRPYQFSVVASQWLLLAIWGLWWHATVGNGHLWRGCPVALLGVLLAAGGASMATIAHWEVGYRRTPPAPWDDPRVNAPPDMLSRVVPELLVPEAIQIALAVGVAAVVFLWPLVKRGLR